MSNEDQLRRAALNRIATHRLTTPVELQQISDPYRPCRATDRPLCTARYDKPTHSITCECPWTPDGPTAYPIPEDTP